MVQVDRINFGQLTRTQPISGSPRRGEVPAASISFASKTPSLDGFDARQVANFDPNGNLSPVHKGKFSLFA